MILSWLNEIELPKIARGYSKKPENETILVAGGGKFTARFEINDTPEEETKDKNNEKNKAEQAKDEIIKELSTAFPMLEFQDSQVKDAEKFSKIRKDIMDDLKTQKQGFRGYGLSFNPHFEVCSECGEYPAVRSKKIKEKLVCSVCHAAHESSSDLKKMYQHFQEKKDECTTLEKIYSSYIAEIPESLNANVPYDFEDMFPKKEDPKEQQKKRMAVWFSDINSMKNKVSLWLNQEETEIFGTFKQVKDVFSGIITQALKETFPGEKIKEAFLPFRIIIAGGDDFCIVMDEKYILDFVVNLSSNLDTKFKSLPADHPLSQKWLEKKFNALKEEDSNIKIEEKDIKQPYCFGGSFIVCSLHTPFSRIHEIGEELMKAAKTETKRQGNSVNWRIMAEEESQSDKLLCFEKPIFIESDANKESWDKLSFNEYMDLRKKYSKISSSQQHQIASMMIKLNKEPEKLERWLMIHASSELEKNLTGLINEEKLRIGKTKDGGLMPERLATLLELLSIGGESDGDK